MKTNHRWMWQAVVVVGLACATAQAGEVAVVTENHINVRGQPSLTGEVITQMKKGEKVVILEEIPVEKPKKGEPGKWARIQMPANTPVWVFASLLDPNNKTVTVSRLNLRAGPGENYSIVGRLDRGEAVKAIRTVDDWMEIEAPEKAYAFIAAEYVSKTETKPEAPIAKTEKPEPPAESAKPAVPPPATSEPTPQGTAPSFAGQPTGRPPSGQTPAIPTTPAETTPAATKVEPAVVPAPETVAPTPAPITLPPETAAPPSTEPAPPPRRIVTREGVVRGTKSIQAPTWYELVGADTGRPINYLHTLDPELNLKTFRGKKIIVTGEEGIDPRWPMTPILEIVTIKVAP